MRRSLILLLITGLALLPLRAQVRTVERSYVTTDRSVYVAGDRIWVSAFCVTGEGRLSEGSRVAYLELHSADGVAATAKMALDGGRGAGYIDLPTSLPTGNYRLIAYTAQNKDEVDYDYTGLCSKTLSIFNVFSTDRVKDGVEVVSPEAYENRHARLDRASQTPGQAGYDVNKGVVLEWTADSTLRITNKTGEHISFSLSIAREDAILPPANPDIAGFLAAAKQVGRRTFRGEVLPEMEGEVIHGRIVADPATLRTLLGHSVFISTPSEQAEVYTSQVIGDGSLTFVTGNIFGNQELVCEIEDVDPQATVRFAFDSPFVQVPVAVPERLRLSPSLGEALKARSLAMQQERRTASDALYDYLPRREYPLLDGTPIRYILDDYTRFGTLEETFIEFIPQVRTRKVSSRTEIQVRLEEAPDARVFTGGSSLVLLDGVPILDHERLLQYDPHLVQRIDVYPYSHYLGSRVYEGVVNLITFEHNLPRYPLGKTMKVIAFPGVCWPVARVGWHPILELDSGETLTLPCRFEDASGSFNATLEGITATARPVVCSVRFF